MVRHLHSSLQRTGAFAVAVMLAGCSALQIDVDVYKGALSHEPDIQAQQYAVLAMAAKPVLATLRNRLHERAHPKQQPAEPWMNNETIYAGSPDCKDVRDVQRRTKTLQQVTTDRQARTGQPLPAPSVRQPGIQVPVDERNKYSYWVRFDDQATFYINGLLSFYEPVFCVNSADDWHVARADEGLIELFNRFKDASLALAEKPGDKDRIANLRAATAYLTDSLIPFAERILFVVNNPSLFSDDNYRIERAILQTLGNSLILHANDLRRRQAHEANQQMRFDAQRRAAAPVTVAQGPALLLDSVARQVATASSRAAAAASAAGAAVTASQAAQGRAIEDRKKTAADLAKAEKAWKAWKHPVPAVNFAHATLVDPATADDVPAAEQDRAQLVARAAAFKAGEAVSARALADDLLAWVAGERDAKLAAGQRQKRIEGLALALHRTEPLVSLSSIPSGPAPQVLSDVAKAIAKAQAGHMAARGALGAALAKAQADDAAADQREQAAKADLLAKQAKQRSDEAADKQASAVKKVIAEAMTGAIAATSGTPSMHPEAVRQVLLARLEAIDVTKASADEKAHARTALAALTLRPAFSFRTGDFGDADENHGNRKTAMQVLEDLVAYLRTRRTAVLAEKGDGDEARNLALAIESAEQQRTDQVFLRPSADYLRNVYASTALQDETRPANRNMLLDYLRNLTPVGERDKGGGENDAGRDINKARADLEKLFWQNINRVTTNGGTNANHVIAKDDVGNWYIKTFSTDPKQVFESAKSLLLFNQGGRIDSNLLRRAELRDQARNGTQVEKDAANAELSRLGQSPAGLAVGMRAQKRFQDRYADETKELALALQQRIPDLPEKELASAWAAVLPVAASTPTPAASSVPVQPLADLKKALVTGAGQLQNGSLAHGLAQLDSHIKRLADPTQSPSKLGGQIVAVLNLLMGYREDLVTMAQQQPALAGSDQAVQLQNVNAASRRTINRLIEEVVQQRQRTVDSYQEGLASIADTVR